MSFQQNKADSSICITLADDCKTGFEMIDIENELNPSQAAAVTCTDGPQMVIAGAGSGKTRVLTYRIAHLLELGVEPWSVLALTFTNKAAGEMKERIADKVGESRARYLWMGTFHSIFSRILRAEAEKIGFTPNFTIYDQSDSQSLIKHIIKEMQLDDKVYKASAIQNRISNAKNRLCTPEDYLQNGDILKNDRFRNIGACGQIYQKYVSRCRQADVMDFDDLLLNTYLLFKQNEDVRVRYADRFKYVLVDEYQDTNYAQHCIVWQLTRDNRQVCVVGDDAQSIYSFRGANIDNMLKFTNLYPEAQVFKLEQNYRSTRNIVGAANSLIEKNRNQIHKTVFSENEDGAKIQVFQVQSDIAEALMVADNIGRLHSSQGVGYGEMAVLYRTNGQSRVIEENFRAQGIPYKIYGSLSFYMRKEIKDVIAYFRLVVNHSDEEALKRVINTPKRGIGDTTVDRISQTASDANVTMWEVMTHPDSYDAGIGNAAANRILQFAGMIGRFSEMLQTESAYSLATHIVEESGLTHEMAMDKSDEGRDHLNNVQELMNGIDSFCRARMEEGDEHMLLTDFLSEVSLMTSQDNETEDDAEKVTLMTVHAAKGLEFDSVFVVGMEENLFPNQMCMENERQIEEERRLFYVAITRAKRNCMLLFSKCRFIRGSLEMSEPSRFIKDIDSKFLEMHLLGGTVRPRYTARDSDFDDVFGDDDGFMSRRTSFASRPQNEGSYSRFEAKTPSHRLEPRNRPASESTPPGSSFESRPRNLQKVSVLLAGTSGGSGAPAPVAAGDVIDHERFGRGEVLSVEGSGDECKARIHFANSGDKTLLLKFARFTVVKK